MSSHRLTTSEIADLRRWAARPLAAAPSTFAGTLADLIDQVVLPTLPEPRHVARWHELLTTYAQSSDPIFIIRMLKGASERGQVYKTAAGHRLKSADNAPAWWVHFVAYNGLDIAHDDLAAVVDIIPTHLFEVGRRLPPKTINHAKYYVAHIFSAKNRDTDWHNWSRAELERRFLRTLHPCNCFYVPKFDGHRYGENPEIISVFADLYAERYADVWPDFLRLIQADRLVPHRSADAIPYAYSEDANGQPTEKRSPSQKAQRAQPKETQPPVQKTQAAIAEEGILSYKSTGLTFKAKLIEPLGPGDAFRVITPHGVFQMTKAQFYADFPNVVRSPSYQVGGIYSYSAVPAKAKRYLIAPNSDD